MNKIATLIAPPSAESATNPAMLPPEATEILGRAATGDVEIEPIGQPLPADTVSEAQIKAGLKQLEDLANGKNSANDQGAVNDNPAQENSPGKHLIHDKDEAHEAAIIENEIRDVYDEAHQQNDDFTTQQTDDTHLPAEESTAQAAPSAASPELKEHDMSPLALQTRDKLLGEAADALKHAGVANVLISTTARLTKDTNGNIYIADGPHAESLQPLPGGAYKRTIYDFDPRKDELTIISNDGTSIVASIRQYQPTKTSERQTGEIELPQAVANSFGFDRAIALHPVKQEAQAAA